jgi:ubiquinol-cytochrome c reductase iron-sulfur subunit
MSDTQVDTSKRTWLIASGCAGCSGRRLHRRPVCQQFPALGAGQGRRCRGRSRHQRSSRAKRSLSNGAASRSGSCAARPKQLAALPKTLDPQLADPKSQRKPDEFTPEYARNETRSIKPEFLVVVGICTHLGCSPSDKFQSRPAAIAARRLEGRLLLPLPWFHVRSGRPGLQEQAGAGQPGCSAAHVPVRHPAADR